jgi:hypothetical protein
MSDPRTGGVTEPPRKTKKNGVKNLNGAQAIPEFHHHFFMNRSGFEELEISLKNLVSPKK